MCFLQPSLSTVLEQQPTGACSCMHCKSLCPEENQPTTETVCSVVTLYSIAAPCALHGRSVLTTCTPCRSQCIHLVHTTQCNTYEGLLGINRMVEISIQKCLGFKRSLQLQKCSKSGPKLFLHQFSHSSIALLRPK